MDIEPVSPPSVPLPVKAVGGLAVAVAGFLLLRWLLGTVLFFIKVGVVLAVIAAVIVVGSKVFGSKGFGGNKEV